jgi:hypothetical protein
MFAFGVPSLLESLIAITWWLNQMNQFAGTQQWWYYILQPAAGLVQMGIGAYFFFGGEWIVNRAIPSNRPYCPECGYDLSKSRSERCPECGVTLPESPEDH